MSDKLLGAWVNGKAAEAHLEKDVVFSVPPPKGSEVLVLLEINGNPITAHLDYSERQFLEKQSEKKK